MLQSYFAVTSRVNRRRCIFDFRNEPAGSRYAITATTITTRILTPANIYQQLQRKKQNKLSLLSTNKHMRHEFPDAQNQRTQELSHNLPTTHNTMISHIFFLELHLSVRVTSR